MKNQITGISCLVMAALWLVLGDDSAATCVWCVGAIICNLDRD